MAFHVRTWLRATANTLSSRVKSIFRLNSLKCVSVVCNLMFQKMYPPGNHTHQQITKLASCRYFWLKCRVNHKSEVKAIDWLDLELQLTITLTVEFQNGLDLHPHSQGVNQASWSGVWTTSAGSCQCKGTMNEVPYKFPKSSDCFPKGTTSGDHHLTVEGFVSL